jgi:hypothetical protein
MASRDDYEEVEVLRDETGVIAVISRDKRTGYYSYAFAKEYEHRGERRRSSFLSRRHALGVRRLVTRVEQYLDPRIDKEMAGARAD